MAEGSFDFSKVHLKGKKITKEDIFNGYYDQVILFERYFGNTISLKKSYCNRLRVDQGAGCKFGYKNGILYFYDYARSKSYDVIQWVMEDLNLNYNEALNKIYNDFQMKSQTIPIIQTPYDIVESEIKIAIQPKEFNKKFIDYFTSHLIPLDICKQEDVYCVGKLYYDGERCYLPEDELCIAYYYSEIDKIKILRPDQPKKYKWRSNVPNTYIDGLTKVDKSLGYVIIVKSKKDKLLVLSLGYKNVLALQMEGKFVITEETEKELEGLHKIIWLDNDITGKDVSAFYAKKGYDPILLEDFYLSSFKCKDPSDYSRNFHNTDLIKQLLNNKINGR